MRGSGFPWCGGDGADPAVTTDFGVITYHELRGRVAHVGAVLQARLCGIETSRVAIVLPLGLDFIVALLATLECGLLVIPVDPNLPDDRLNSVVKDSAALLVLGDDSLSARLNREAGEVTVTTVRELLDSPKGAETHPLPWKGILLSTSGSTGAPKGVELPGFMMLHEATTLVERLQISREDRVSHLLSPTVIGGLREIFSALMVGATLVPLEIRRLGIPGLIEQLEHRRVTICRMVATMFRAVCHGMSGHHRLSIRRLYIGGERLLSSDVQLFRQHFPATCRLDNVFGATEFGLCTHFPVPPSFAPNKTGSVPMGRANEGYELRVVDDSGREVPQGDLGRLEVAGAWIAQAYWFEGQRDSTPFPNHPTRPGWRVFRTEDLVRMNPAGDLEYCGRADRQAKIRGNRVELGEVENCLLSADDVVDAGVVDVEIDGVCRLYAVVQRTPDSGIDLAQWCRQSLAPAAIPARIMEIPSLPRSLQGKCDRRRLREIVVEQLAKIEQAGPPVVSTTDAGVRRSDEELLEAIWRQALKLSPTETVDWSTPFRGDSMAMFECLLNLRKHLRVEVSPADFDRSPTLGQLQTLISHTATRVTEDTTCVLLSEPHPGPCLFLMHGSVGECGIYKPLARSWTPAIALQGVLVDWLRLGGCPDFPFSAIVDSAVRSIRSRQTSGPYLVAGYSYGGVVAWEVANQLLREGQEVAYCGLIDSLLPYSLRYLARNRPLVPMLKNVPLWLIDFLRNAKYRSALRRFIARRTEPEGRLENFTRWNETQQGRTRVLLRAHDEHSLSRGPFPLWIYQSRVRPLIHSHRLADLWRAETAAQVNLRIIPGNHRSIMTAPHSRLLAQTIASDIVELLAQREAQQRTDGTENSRGKRLELPASVESPPDS